MYIYVYPPSTLLNFPVILQGYLISITLLPLKPLKHFWALSSCLPPTFPLQVDLHYVLNVCE